MKTTAQKVSTIYFDMDGVLVDLHGYLADIEGQNFQAMYLDMKKAHPELDPVITLIKRHISKEIFIHAPQLLPDFDFFKGMMEHWPDVHYAILSSGSTQPESPEIIRQKKIWLAKHGLGEMDAKFVNGAKFKQQYAQPGALLIDDKLASVEQFRKAGGQAIHHKNLQQTIKELELLLSRDEPDEGDVEG